MIQTGQAGNRILASAQLDRFKRTGNQADLEDAVRLLRGCGRRHPRRPSPPGASPDQPRQRAQGPVPAHQEAPDLDDAINALQAAVKATAEDNPDRAVMLSNLGTALQERFGLAGGKADLDNAIRPRKPLQHHS